MSQQQRHSSLGAIAVLAFAVLAGACASSTSMENKWAPKGAQAAAPLTKVVTVFISQSESIRRSGEDRLAHELTQTGVSARPAYTLVSPAERATIDKVMQEPGSPEVEGMKARLRGMGFDGIVTMQIVDKEQEIAYSPSYYGSYGGYWGYGWGYGGYSPGSVYTQNTYRTETTAYSLRTNQVVLSARLKTVDPSSAKSLLGSTAKRVTRELEKQRKEG